MDQVGELGVRCEDFLKGSRYLYAHKARRKKIALVRLELSNPGPSAAEVDLGGAELLAGERRIRSEPPERILRRFSEFTWDFLAFAVLDFNPWLALVDLGVFLVGPIYNRRLERQLSELRGGEVTLGAGESVPVLLGFGKAAAPPAELSVPWRRDNERTWRRGVYPVC